MSYRAAIEQLNTLAPELYTQPGQPRRKFSLDEVRTLLAELGNPQLRYPSVLIAGTNGKGSTAATLASILTASGVRTGLFTSPHLTRVNERIRVDGVEIGDEAFGGIFFRIQSAADALLAQGRLPQLPSYFEILTALGLIYFSESGVELAVLEVGLGGRLDATNAVEPAVSVVTDISLDHTEWLGSTIEAIAREKAGILRQGRSFVSLPQHPDANRILGETAMELNAHAISATAYMPALEAARSGAYAVKAMGAWVEVDSPLAGAHQRRNVALAIAAALELAAKEGLKITPASISAGIRQTVWPGRLERIARRGVEWILDVAHNPAGAWALRAGLSTMLATPGTLVFSCLRDKALTEIAQILFPLFDHVVVAPMKNPRGTPLEELLSAAQATGVRASAAGSVRQALEMAGVSAEGRTIVVSGSVYLVGEARSFLLDEGHS